MASCRSIPWCRGLALAVALALLVPVAAAVAADGVAKAPDWPNLLSEAGRRAAWSLSPSSPWHLEPTLADIEDAERAAAQPSLDAKARYDGWRIDTAGTPPNTRANNPAGDQGAPAADTQSECAVAVHGQNVVVAWNDSKGLRLGAPTTVTSYAYSCDGGATFTDGGDVPLNSLSDQSFGDCTLDVDNAGNFYLGVIYVSGGVTQDAAVYRGTFGGGCSFSWGPRVIAASGASGVIDKPYLCVNPVDGSIYLSFTRFSASTTIEVVRGTALGTVWTAPVVLETAGGIQGSRPHVGPAGDVYVCWQAGWGTINCDLSSTTGTIRLRRCVNPGASFSFLGVVSAGTVNHNWTSYWAGNLRNNALYFPDMAIDRSGLGTNGYVYVVWNDAASWPAPAASGVSTAELETNNTPSDANVRTINPGDNATGTISTSGDFDYWKLNVTAGQHIMLRLEPQGFNCGVTGTIRNFQLRMFKGIAGTAGDSILANSNLNQFASEIVFDAPETATYLFRVRNVNTSGTLTGTYTVKSRLLTMSPTPSRDMRDVVCVRSTNLGASFGGKVLVNNDPANLDNCIPAVAVDQDGCVHVFFYDARDAAGARILRSYYQGVSTNAGVSFATNQRISNELSYFNLNTVAVPNYGEYNQACTARNTTDDRVHCTWSDERLSVAAAGSGVDAYHAALKTCVTVTCAPDQIGASGTAVNFNVCIDNCGSYANDFSYNINDTQGWCGPAAGTVTVAAGGSTCIPVTCNIPPATPDGTVTTVTLAASAVDCPAENATCVTNITVQNAVSLPPAGADCFQSTAQVTVEIFNVGVTTLNLSGPSMVQRKSPVPAGPGYTIDTEMVSMSLTGSDPLLGPVTLRESGLYVSDGKITTGPSPFFPADSFFDIFFEIDTGSGTFFNKNRLRMDATINAIPPVGDPFHGNDVLIYPHGANEGTPIGRVVSVVHTPGPPFDWFPPPGSDCLSTLIDMTVFIDQMGTTDQLAGSGPMMVTRGAAVDPGDGRPEIQTEIVSMELVGNGALVGPFRLIESPSQPSPGLIKSQAPGSPYPADSFFDVFFELELPNLGVTAIGVGATNMQAVINTIPPLGTPYLNTTTVQLIDKNTLVPLGHLQLVRHTPDVPIDWAPPPDIDCFNSTAQVTVDILGLGTDTVQLAGPTMIARGPAHDIGGGMLVIDTEMLSLELTGFSPLFGAVTVEEDVDRASTGQIAGPSPGVILPADSFFDVFFILKTSAGWLRPQIPVRMHNPGLPAVPPPPGTQYQGINNPVLLVDSGGNVRGRVLVEIHDVGPPFVWTTDTPLDREEGPFFGLRGAYPNPFASRTSVSFRLDRERHVRMRVYNVRGEVVRTVHDATLGAGLNVLEWNGKDDAGHAVGTGVYFYRVDVDGESVTRKVIKMQ